MDKFTLFELHVHDGMEVSGNQMGPGFGRRSVDEDEEYEELAEVVAGDDEYEEDGPTDDSSGRGPSPLPLLLTLVAIVVVAVALRKLAGSDIETEIEIAELDDLAESYDEAEAER